LKEAAERDQQRQAELREEIEKLQKEALASQRVHQAAVEALKAQHDREVEATKREVLFSSPLLR
jgi:hypothetical protein